MNLLKKMLKDKLAILSILILSVVLIGILFAGFLAPYDPNQQDLINKLATPSSDHILGTDQLGRDIFSRLLYGGRVTIILSLGIVFLILLIGLLFGSLAGMLGGTVDAGIMRLCDWILSLPSEMLSLCMIGILGPSVLTIILALTIVRLPWYIKMIRSEIRNDQTKNYVIFSLVSGKSKSWVFKNHSWRPLSRSLVVYSTLDISAVIMSISALSFLGIGIQPPTAEWGRMLNDAREVAVIEPWQMIPAGVALFLVVALLNYLSDVLTEAMHEVNWGE